MESPVKIDVDCEAGSCGNGLRRGERAETAASMSRRAMSYSIDNLLATSATHRRDYDSRPAAAAAAASLRLHAISQQRTLTRFTAVSPPGQFAPMQQRIGQYHRGQFAPWNFRSRERNGPGTCY